MEIVKNPAYLRFVKYEHWLAFAGVGVLILQIISTLLPLGIYPIYIFPFIYFSIIVTIIKLDSLFYLGISESRPLLISLIFFIIGIPLLSFPFEVLTYNYFLLYFVIVQELFWRGIFIEVLKRLGFGIVLSVLLSVTLSTFSYLLYIPSEALHKIDFQNFPMISLLFSFLLIAGLIRVKFNMNISLFWTILWSILILSIVHTID